MYNNKRRILQINGFNIYHYKIRFDDFNLYLHLISIKK